jgi:hypothetical protein
VEKIVKRGFYLAVGSTSGVKVVKKTTTLVPRDSSAQETRDSIISSGGSGKEEIFRLIAAEDHRRCRNPTGLITDEQNPKQKGGEIMLNQVVIVGNLGAPPKPTFHQRGPP